MSSFNKVILMGNLTRDPESKTLASGTCIAKISLAVNRKWRSESGEQKEEVTFVDVDMFGRTAENVSQYMRKGSSILVEGRLKQDRWEDKTDHKPRQRLGVVAETVQFLGGGSKESGNSQESRIDPPPSIHSPAASNKPCDKSDAFETKEDDVPF